MAKRGPKVRNADRDAEIVAAVRQGVPQAELGRKYKVSRQRVRQILDEQAWDGESLPGGVKPLGDVDLLSLPLAAAAKAWRAAHGLTAKQAGEMCVPPVSADAFTKAGTKQGRRVVEEAVRALVGAGQKIV